MLPLFLLLLLGWHYFQLSMGKSTSGQDLVSDGWTLGPTQIHTADPEALLGRVN